MKTLFKVLALVLMLTMTFSTVAFAANPFVDVDGSMNYAEAVTMLNDLGIIDGYEEDGMTFFKPDQTISRAEVAKIIVCSLGAEDVAAGAANVNTFTDVPASHWATGYVNYIVGYNDIVAGYGDGTFGPSDPVLYEQVIKMVVCALGYYPMAMQRGGYPTGFLAVASELGLTKGASGSASEPAKRSTVARIIYNALTVPLMKQVGWDANKPEYVVTGKGDYEEETLLTDKLDVIKINGIVTETFFQGDVDKDHLTVTIEGLSKEDAKAVNDDENVTAITIDIGNTEAQNYHGYAVTAYIYTDEDTDEQKLLAIAPRSNRNTVVAVALDDLYEMTEKDINKNKGYATVGFDDENGKEISVKVDLNSAFYVNLDEENIEDIAAFINGFKDKNGAITFIQNDTSDQYADYVFVEYFSGIEYVVTGLNEAKTKVNYDYMDGSSAKKSGSEVLDAEDDDAWVFFYRNGKSIDFKDIKEGNVISKIQNSAKTVTKVYVSDQTVEGKVSAINSDKETVTMGKVKWDYAPGIFSSASIGESYITYLSVTDKIVFFDKLEGTASNDDYALLFSAAQDEDKWGNNTTVTVKLLGADGEWDEYDIADKVTVKYGGNEYRTANIADFLSNCDALTGGLVSFDGDNKFNGFVGVVQYKLNSSGKVSTLTVPFLGKTDEYLSCDDFVWQLFKAEDNTLGKLDLNDDMVIFTFNGKDLTDEDSFGVSSISGVFTDEDRYSGSFYISEGGDTDEPNCLFVHTNGAEVKYNTQLFVVTESGEAENKDGDSQTVLSGYTNGNADEQTFFVADDCTCDVTGLSEGDVIAVTYNADGEIYDVAIWALANSVATDAAFYQSFKDANDKDVEVMFGYVADSATSKAGVKYFELSNVFDNAAVEAKDVEKVARVRENKLTGNVYYVDLSKKNLEVTVTDSFDDIQANNINIKNGSTVKGGEGYFMYAQTYEGDIVDAVVFIIDCADLF